MKRVVAIKNVGNVAFPDQMSDDEVNKASGQLHAQANPTPQAEPQEQAPPDITPVMVIITKSLGKGSISEQHKKMSAIAKVLEDNPVLAQLAIAGAQTLSSQGSTGDGGSQQESQSAAPQSQGAPDSSQSSTQPPEDQSPQS